MFFRPVELNYLNQGGQDFRMCRMKFSNPENLLILIIQIQTVASHIHVKFKAPDIIKVSDTYFYSCSLLKGLSIIFIIAGTISNEYFSTRKIIGSSWEKLKNTFTRTVPCLHGH